MGWEPISLSAQDIQALTTEGKRQIVAHNKYGEELGCW